MESWNASACIPVELLDRCFWNRSERQPLLRAEYILALPSDVSLELHRSNTPSLQYSITPILQYSNTPILQYSNTPILHYSISSPVHSAPVCLR